MKLFFSSGLIAGEGLVGISLAVPAVTKINGKSIGDIINLGTPPGNIGGVVFFIAILAVTYYFSAKKSVLL